MEKPADCVLWSWILLLTVTALPLTAAVAVLLPYLPLAWRGWLWVVWGGVFVGIACVYLPLRRRNMCFSLTEDCVEVTSGVVFVTTRRIRYEAVRQVTLLQGPIERRCHTAFLLVSGTGGYLLVEGIDLAQAERWCHRLYPR
ncbi:MAG: PH domain-containing protein [Clostridia bacterium]|nr:PH domain-containing protein [Clostridia bacterium]